MKRMHSYQKVGSALALALTALQPLPVAAQNLASTQGHVGDRGLAFDRKPRRRVRRSIASLPAKVKSDEVTREIPLWEEQSGTGFAIFLGAGGGYLLTSPKSGTLEAGKSGPTLMGRGTLSFYNDSLNLDLSLGWMQSQISGSLETQSESGKTTNYRQADVITRAGLVEFSPRLKLGQRLSLGPTAGVLFGTQANFGESAIDSNAPVFLGLKGAYGWYMKHYQIRAVLQASMSLTIPERSAYMTVAGVEIGLPLVKGKTLLREREVTTVRENFQVETIETERTVVQKVVQPVDRIKEVLVFTLDDQVVHFEFDRARLLPHSRNFLLGLGRYLAENPEKWESVRIVGHTDERGSDEYNQSLSVARAESVRQALVQAGVPTQKLDSLGLGKRRTIASGGDELSHARNRRVELGFSGVTDARELRDTIQRLRLANLQPGTCRDGKCR